LLGLEVPRLFHLIQGLVKASSCGEQPGILKVGFGLLWIEIGRLLDLAFRPRPVVFEPEQPFGPVEMREREPRIELQRLPLGNLEERRHLPFGPLPFQELVAEGGPGGRVSRR